MTSVLVTFDSKHGSTAEIADVLAETLCECGLDVDCIEAGEVDRLDGYDAVIVGSAVYLRRWRREARRLLHRFAAELAERPLWVFSTGPVGDRRETIRSGSSPAGRSARSSDSAPVATSCSAAARSPLRSPRDSATGATGTRSARGRAASPPSCRHRRPMKTRTDMSFNAEWHRQHPMPKNPTFEQRVAWHREHARECWCRKPPPDIAALLANEPKPESAHRP